MYRVRNDFFTFSTRVHHRGRHRKRYEKPSDNVPFSKSIPPSSYDVEHDDENVETTVESDRLDYVNKLPQRFQRRLSMTHI